MIIPLPEGYKVNNSLSMYFQLTVYYIVRLCSTGFTVTVNNIEVTVNTCICTDVFTTKDHAIRWDI